MTIAPPALLIAGLLLLVSLFAVSFHITKKGFDARWTTLALAVVITLAIHLAGVVPFVMALDSGASPHPDSFRPNWEQACRENDFEYVRPRI